MSGKNFHEIIQLICKDDTRYEPGAYHFMRQGLDYTLGKIRKEEETTANRHITGQELSEGLREYALGQYGPMAFTLLEQWGVKRTEDFGEIVFNLVEYGVFGKTETDSREDFVGLFDFKTAFKEPFLPIGAQKEPSAIPGPQSPDSQE